MFLALPSSGRRTARSTAITAWRRAGGCSPAEWCSGGCCIWARSTTASKRRGARRWRCSMKQQQQCDDAESVSRRSAGPGRCAGQRAGQAERDATAAARGRIGNCWLGCELWRQLELDRVLGGATAAGARRSAVGAGAGIAGGQPADRSGQRVPFAPAVV